MLLLVLIPLACGTPAPRSFEIPEQPDPELAAAREVIMRLADTIIDVAKRGDALGFQGRMETISPVLLEIFDVRTMARLTLAESWEALTPEEQSEWVSLFGEFHTSAIAFRHHTWRGQTFRYLGEKWLAKDVALVSVQLDYPGRNVDLFTDYRLRRSAEGFRVVDVHQPPSVSDVAMRRSEYATVYRDRGFEGIVQAMQERIARHAASRR